MELASKLVWRCCNGINRVTRLSHTKVDDAHLKILLGKAPEETMELKSPDETGDKRCELDCDYLIIGAGNYGLGFADALLALKPDSKLIIVEKNSHPGGHWTDAYDFVKLHQPTRGYGCYSQKMKEGSEICEGDKEPRADKKEILAYFREVLDKMVRTGQVQIFFESFVEPGSSIIRSCTSGKTRKVFVRQKIVDGTFNKIEIPAHRPPPYAVAEGVEVVPPNDLFQLSKAYPAYYVVGAGKTAMDSVTWLLSKGVPADDVHWIMPRNPYVLNRSFMEIGGKPWRLLFNSIIDSTSIEEVFENLERASLLMRVDTSREASCFRFAILSEAELENLRVVRNIIRFGHIQKITSDSIMFQDGVLPKIEGALFVDCTACGTTGVCGGPGPVPIWSEKYITLQGHQAWEIPGGAAHAGFPFTIAYLESELGHDSDKNRLSMLASSQASPSPTTLLKVVYVTYLTVQRWKNEGLYEDWHARMVERGWVFETDAEYALLETRAMDQLAKILAL